jgi:tRNA (adenine37-N6)-methyltransferase
MIVWSCPFVAFDYCLHVSIQFGINAIGFVRSSRTQPEDDSWDVETSHIEMISPFDARSLMGLDSFSHCIVVYVFDRAGWDDSRMSRHPRGNKDWPEVGIFAQRAKDRPNRLGVTVCRILEVEDSIVRVAGLDAIDGTPVVDIKPWMLEFGPRGAVSQPQWASELMLDYW